MKKIFKTIYPIYLYISERAVMRRELEVPIGDELVLGSSRLRGAEARELVPAESPRRLGLEARGLDFESSRLSGRGEDVSIG